MSSDRLVRLALGALAVPLLLLPAAAQATVTIGSDLGRAGNASTSACAGGVCTFAIGALAPDRQAAGGIASPVNGTVTTWRIRAGISSGPAALRVVRPLAGGLYSSGGATSQVTPATDAISTYAAQLPIQRGDLIGVDCCGASSTFFTASGPPTSRLDFEPGPLADGPGTAPVDSDGFEVLINADIEPTSAFTVAKGRQKKGGAITMIAQLPNVGTLTAEGTKMKPRLLKASSAEAGPGPVSVTLATTKAAKARLAERGRVKLGVKVTFTPMGGSPATQTLKVKLRKKAR
jgi:hypothetical protein